MHPAVHKEYYVRRRRARFSGKMPATETGLHATARVEYVCLASPSWEGASSPPLNKMIMDACRRLAGRLDD